MLNFSEKIQKLRKERNISIRQMAKDINVSPTSIMNWEKGKVKRMQFCHIFAVLNYFKISLLSFLSEN